MTVRGQEQRFDAKNRSRWRRYTSRFCLALLIACIGSHAHINPANAVKIELHDVAADRIERQRAHAAGTLELPGTPNLDQLEERLAAAGLKLGAPIFIRLFKAESELEIWMKKGERFVLFATYPMCHWSGTLGPKQMEGDRQNPEGFYAINRRNLHRSGRWPNSLNVGYPNRLDRGLDRTGSYILIHGGCTSVGCFAMTDGVAKEIFKLANRALRAGQKRIDLHAFPFRMTQANLDRFSDDQWADFWRDLKNGYDAFNATRIPPTVSVCNNRYEIKAVNEYRHTTSSRRRSRRTWWTSYPPKGDCSEANTSTRSASNEAPISPSSKTGKAKAEVEAN